MLTLEVTNEAMTRILQKRQTFVFVVGHGRSIQDGEAIKLVTPGGETTHSMFAGYVSYTDDKQTTQVISIR